MRKFFQSLLEGILDEKLRPIHSKLDNIEQQQSMNKAAFLALLATLAAGIAQVKTDVEAIQAKAANGEDFTDEANAVNASIQALSDIHTEATATVQNSGTGTDSGATPTDSGTPSTDPNAAPAPASN